MTFLYSVCVFMCVCVYVYVCVYVCVCMCVCVCYQRRVLICCVWCRLVESAIPDETKNWRAGWQVCNDSTTSSSNLSDTYFNNQVDFENRTLVRPWNSCCGQFFFLHILWPEMSIINYESRLHNQWRVNQKSRARNIQSNRVITSWKGLNILCRYIRGLLLPRSVMLWLTVRN